MPYHLELGSGAHKFMNKAIVVNSLTGHHYSKDPIPVPRAKAQMRILEKATHEEHDPPNDHKFIQHVTESPKFRAGAFTKKAEKAGMSSLEFMRNVLQNPGDYDLRTRREAQFLHNIQPHKK